MQKKVFTKKFSLRIITVICFVFIFFIAFGLVREIIHRYKLNQEIKKIENEINGLENNNKELSGLIDYLNTDSFKEIQARQNLGMQKEGESAISIESIPDNAQGNKVEFLNDTKVEKTNFEKWWNYFFSGDK